MSLLAPVPSKLPSKSPVGIAPVGAAWGSRRGPVGAACGSSMVTGFLAESFGAEFALEAKRARQIKTTCCKLSF